MRKKYIIIFFIMVVFMFRREVKALEESMPEVSLRPNVEYKSEGLRDPFQSYLKEKESAQAQREAELNVPKQPLPSLVVQGVIWGGKFSQAIINNKVVKAGDTIEGVEIVEIDKEGIKILFGNEEYILSSPAAASLPKKPEGG